jgi:hypothetical protein
VHAISEFTSVKMGLEIPFSNRKTVAEDVAYTEHVSILSIFEV